MVASISPNTLFSNLAGDAQPLVIDVRREPAYRVSPHILPGSIWRRPEDAAAWLTGLRRDRTVVVYCVHGHEVSQGVATALADAGIDTLYLEGGIEGWATAGLPLADKENGGR